MSKRKNIKIMKLYLDLGLSPLPDHRNILKNDYTINNITIPKGYVTNGANIPKLFWNIVPPNDSTAMPAVVLHDFICTIANYMFSYKNIPPDTVLSIFKRADYEFDKALKTIEISNKKRLFYIFGVKGYTKVIRPIEYRLRNKSYVYTRNKRLLDGLDINMEDYLYENRK